ncbi:hypothetical protein [Amycolatopsis sp. CA-126428]|uniref:hypothetical protein n=1 Tax=Amycolatopsis sp. CA-126428 TaxID=2073158 RepID=UPI000CD03B1D|nr:hypothetical protein [Amycolatopsis sp. CA-126428]
MVQLAADAAPPVGPSWLAVALAVFAALVTAVTAVMPAAVEKIKQRASSTTASTAVPSPGRQTDKALDMIEESMRDLRRQRDEAERETTRLHELLAARETELRRRGWRGE